MTSTRSRKLPARQGRRWRVAAVALVGVAAAVLLWLGRSSRAPEPRAPSPLQPEAARVPPPAAAPVRASAAPVQPKEQRPLEKGLEELELSAAQARLKTIRMRRAYPLWTQPLDLANVWTPPAPFMGSSSEVNPGGRIFVVAERPQAEVGAAVRIFVMAIDGAGQPAPIEGLQGHTTERWYGQAPHPVIPIAFNDDGASGDDQPGDRVYTGVLAPGADRAAACDWTVAVEGIIAGDRRGANTVVLFEPNDARFTGEFSEEIAGGSLVVHAGVEIVRPAFTHVRLELFAGERPIAQAWAAQTPDAPGRRTFDVTFYGKVIHDAGVGGPFTVRHAILTTAGDDGRFPGPVVDPVLVTRPYPRSLFTDRDMNGGNVLLAEQERLALEDIEAAKRGDDGPQPRRMTLIDKYKTPAPQ